MMKATLYTYTNDRAKDSQVCCILQFMTVY